MTYLTALSRASVNCYMIIYSRYSKFRFRWWFGAHLAEKSSVFLILIWRQNCVGLHEVWYQSVHCFKLNRKCTWALCTQHVSQFSAAVHNYQTVIKAWGSLDKVTEAGSFSQTQLRDCFLRAGVHAPTKSVSVPASISLLPPVQPRSGLHTYRQNRYRRVQGLQITWKMSVHLLCAPVQRIYQGGCRHHADMSVIVLKTLPCRPHVLPGHKDYMKYQYHQYRRWGRHRFYQCVYTRPYPFISGQEKIQLMKCAVFWIWDNEQSPET